MSTLLEVYRKAVKRLENPGKDEINIRILLSTLANVNSMSDFYIKGDMEFKKEKQFDELFEKYLSGVPVDYLLHKTTFFGFDFYIDSRVLIPRQETEEVIEYAYKILKEKYGDKPLIIADICTGSGCAGIALAMKLNAKKLYLTDYSEQALLVAKKNVEKYKKVLPKTIIRKGDSMFPLIIDRNCKPDVVLSFSWLSIKLGFCQMPAGANWKSLASVCMICGIGFTVSMFIAALSYPAHLGPDAADMLNEAKLGILCGTLASALAGAFLLNQTLPKEAQDDEV